MQEISYYIIPAFILVIFIFCVKTKCNAFDSFVDGVIDGIKTSYHIMPYLIAMFIVVRIFNASGVVQSLFKNPKIPVEFILQGLFRPISSNASISFMFQIFCDYGVDSKIGLASSLIQGGTDTTIYVTALYYGSIGVKKTRYTLVIGLLTDLVCFIIAILFYLFIF